MTPQAQPYQHKHADQDAARRTPRSRSSRLMLLLKFRITPVNRVGSTEPFP
jgi:hypothetical protein